MAYQAIILIRHTDLNRGNFGMIINKDGLCTKGITLFCTRYKHDAIINAERKLSPAIHQRRYGQVG